MNRRLAASSVLAVLENARFPFAAASIIPLLLAAAGCASSADQAQTPGEAEMAATTHQADSLSASAVPPLAFVSKNVWSANQVDGQWGIWTTTQSFFYRGFGPRPPVLRIPTAAQTSSILFPVYDVTKEQPLRVKQNINGMPQDVLAIFNEGKWFIDTNDDQMHESDDAVYSFGIAGDVPVSGNWSSSGIGVFRGGQWYLDMNGNGAWDSSDVIRYFGSPGDIPVVGDWNGDGRSKIGVFNKGVWYLDWNGDGIWDSGDQNQYFGGAGDQPITGAWGHAGAPGRSGAYDAVGVYTNSSGTWSFDTMTDGSFDHDDGQMPFGGSGIKPIVGDFHSSTTGIYIGCGAPYYCFPFKQANLQDPLSVKLRNSVSDPTSFETISYETEYLATVEYLCDDVPNVRTCPRSLVIDAGAASTSFDPTSTTQPGAHAITVVGNSPLEIRDTNPIGFYNDGTPQLHARSWYASPSDNTLARWAEEASSQADILTRAQSYYQLATDYAQLASFNQDQLNTLIDTVQGRVNSTTNPIDKKKWQAILDSLTATRDSQPAPVDASQMSQYLTDLVTTARADMMLQADRAQAMLTMFDAAEAQLTAIATTAAGEIGRLRDTRKSKVSSAKAAPAAKLSAALARVASL